MYYIETFFTNWVLFLIGLKCPNRLYANSIDMGTLVLDPGEKKKLS